MAQSANDNRPPSSGQDHDHGHGEANHFLFAQLPFAAQLLVWGMRQWVSTLKAGDDFAALTGAGFAQFGLAPAGQALDDVFHVIAVSARRQIDIRCVKCRWASEDEILLIDCVGAAQENQFSLAYAGLLEILSPAATRLVMPSLIALATFFAHAGLTVTSRASGPQTNRPDISGAIPETAQRSRRLLQRAAENIAGLEIPALVH